MTDITVEIFDRITVIAENADDPIQIISQGAIGPQGPVGATGPTGATGAQGPRGLAEAAGGTTGQVLAKESNTDYDTVWVTLSTVALSGSYTDLSNKPALSAVALSNNYNDLSNLPTLGTIASHATSDFLASTSTTANVPDSTDRRYITDAQRILLGNTSGTNTGDQFIFSMIAVSGQPNVTANNTSGTLNLVDGSNVSITTNSTTNSITISVVNLTTTNVAEGTNLYFTTSRARQSISVSGDLSYNNSTGIITFTQTYKTPSDLLTAIKTVDGSGSGLDADTIDGLNSTDFLRSNIDQTFSGNLIVSGDLTVSGSTTQVNSSTVTISDPIIALGVDNTTSDAVDSGFYSTYFSTQVKYTGLFRDSSDGNYKLFTGLTQTPTTVVNTSGSGYTIANLVANLIGNVTGNLTGNVTGQVSSISNFTTSNLSEGSNLYFTNVRAEQAVGGILDTTLVYNSGTPSIGRAAITGDISIASGSNTSSIQAGVIHDSQINASAGINATKLGTGTVTNTELSYVHGVTSAIQTQINSINTTLATKTTGPGSSTATAIPVYSDSTGYVFSNTGVTIDGSNNIVGPGYILATGHIVEAATFQGVQIGYGPQGDSPRFWLGNGTSSQNWQIDNDGGTMRFFQPSNTVMSLSSSQFNIDPSTYIGGTLSVNNTITATTGATNLVLSLNSSNAYGVAIQLSPQGTNTHVWELIASGTSNTAGSFYIYDSSAGLIRQTIDSSGNVSFSGNIIAGTWEGTAIADTYISSASTWNSKQAGSAELTAVAGLSTTGYVKRTGTATYVASSTVPYSDISGVTLASGATLSGSNTGDQDLSGLVPKTTTVAGHALSGNVSITLENLSDVSITSPTTNQVLTYSSGTWINQTVSGGGGSSVSFNSYNGDGSTTAFTLSTTPTTINKTLVFINGVYQSKNAYSVSGTTLTLSEAPIAGTDNIEVYVFS